jgi:hypothetical protein
MYAWRAASQIPAWKERLDAKVNSFESLGSEDVDLDMPDRFGAFIGYLSAKIFWLLLIA